MLLSIPIAAARLAPVLVALIAVGSFFSIRDRVDTL